MLGQRDFINRGTRMLGIYIYIPLAVPVLIGLRVSSPC